MNCIIVFVILLVIVCFSWCYIDKSEQFQLDHYLRPNYQSGANMLRGDLPINPIEQSWFNSRYGKTSLAPGFFNI